MALAAVTGLKLKDGVALRLGTRAAGVPMNRLAAMTRQAIEAVQQEAVEALQPASGLPRS